MIFDYLPFINNVHRIKSSYSQREATKHEHLDNIRKEYATTPDDTIGQVLR